MVRFVVAAALLSLGACATADVPYGDRIVWRCDNGVTFSTRNTTKGNAEVEAGNQIYHLPGVKAASGVRYFDGKVEYWEKGATAILNGAAGGPYNNCRG